MLKRIILGLICVVSTVAQSSSTRQYAIDNNHSTIGFSISIMSGMSKVTGKFTDFAITLTNDEQDITKSSVNAVIKTVSINTGIEARDKELRSPAFFDAEKYPEITFQSSRIEKKGNQLVAFGTFAMHGVSKELALPFTVTGPHKNAAGDKMNFGYATRVTLNRRDFGINWRHKTVPDFVGDNVEVEIELITRAIDIK